MKGYKVDTDTYLEVTKDELDNIALESTRTIDIDQFVPRRSGISPAVKADATSMCKPSSLRLTRKTGGSTLPDISPDAAAALVPDKLSSSQI